MKNILIGIVALLVLVLGWYILFPSGDTNEGTTTPTGQNTEGILYQNASDDLVKVELPFPDAVVGRDFVVRGSARGYWFFEASFPVGLLDTEGNVITSGIAQAEGDWMTEEFVRFSAPLIVPSTFSGPAILVLQKDNPSGLPENDASVSFSIVVSE